MGRHSFPIWRRRARSGRSSRILRPRNFRDVEAPPKQCQRRSANFGTCSLAVSVSGERTLWYWGDDSWGRLDLVPGDVYASSPALFYHCVSYCPLGSGALRAGAEGAGRDTPWIEKAAANRRRPLGLRGTPRRHCANRSWQQKATRGLAAEALAIVPVVIVAVVVVFIASIISIFFLTIRVLSCF